MNLADKVMKGDVCTLNAEQQLVVSYMFALWSTRWHWANTPVADQEIEGAISVAVEYSQDEQEQLEKAGITVIRPNLTISGRHFTGTSIKRNIDLVVAQLSDAQWGILTCDDGEFLVPDTASTLRYVPLAPNICFFSQSLDEKITCTGLDEINQEVIRGASEYYFGMKLS